MTVIGQLLESYDTADSVKLLSIYLSDLVDRKQGFNSRLIDGDDFSGLLSHEDSLVRFLSFQLIAPMVNQGLLDVAQFRDVSCFSGIGSGVLKQIAKEEPIKACFPVVYTAENENTEKRVELANVLIFRWNAPNFRYVPVCPKPLPPINVFRGKGALIVFDREIREASFQLAVSAAICWGRLSDKLVFTGAMVEDGSIIPVDFEDEKRRECQKQGKLMIGPSDVKNLGEVEALCVQDVLDVPFLIHISPRGMGGALDALFNAAVFSYSKEGLCHLLNIEDSAFFYKVERQLPDEKEKWYGCLREIQKKISAFIEQVRPRRVRLHLATRVPSAFALMLGAALSGKKLHDLTIYHYDGGIYVPVSGNLVSKMPPVKIRFLERKLCDGISENSPVIGVRIGQDSLETALHGFAEKQKKTAFLIDVGEGAGSLPNGNWTEMMKELKEKMLKSGGERFDLILNVPVAMAAGLGRELGHHKNIRVFHLGKENYIPVCNLKDIRNFAL